MADITLISGSTLGGAEYVAEHLAEKLEEAGFTTETLHGPLLEDLPASGIWLVISSTHGAGDIPDNHAAQTTPSVSMTSMYCQFRLGMLARHSRVYSSMMFSHFICRPLDSLSNTKS